MKTSYNILKICSHCSLILSLLSVLFFSLFMSFSAPLTIENSSIQKTISCNNENIHETNNIESSKTANSDLPGGDTRIDNNYLHCVTLMDFDDNFSRHSELTNQVCDNFSIKFDSNRLVSKYFIQQIISKAKLPTEKALRSDTLLI